MFTELSDFTGRRWYFQVQLLVQKISQAANAIMTEFWKPLVATWMGPKNLLQTKLKNSRKLVNLSGFRKPVNVATSGF